MTESSPGPRPGQRLAHYEILGLIGRGGMGEVHRARDTKLGREVALKLLPRELSGEPERAARFDREARTLASLQHPNVASIYGFEDYEGQRFLVMELVEGQDLSKRVARGPIDVQEATDIAAQIAAGLEAAHEKGIVHRDLKPANVMITPDHEVKILDFGLARAWFGDAGDEIDIGASPTITAAMTAAGTILGTAAYMSPEQARGKAVDRRTDIWAFGVILFEMLTGERLFEGETISDTLAAVLRAEIDGDAIPAERAPLLARVVERCLVRDPRMRLRDIGEVRVLLQAGDGAAASMFGATAAAASSTPAPRRGIPVPAVIVVALVAALAGVFVGGGVLPRAPEPAPLHASITPVPGTRIDLAPAAPGAAVLSPDGRRVAFTARDGAGVTRLYVRDLDRAEPVMISGTENACYPFWSPDGTTVAFFEVVTGAGRLRKVSVGGGPPVTICSARRGKGGTWNEDGVILFAPSAAAPIHRVAAIGGESEPITTLAEGEASHRHPRFLPNGRDFLFVGRAAGGGGPARVYVGSLDGTAPRPLAESQSQAEFSRGHLLTVRDDVLLAAPFDTGALAITGGAIPVVEDVMVVSSGAVLAAFSTAPTGSIVFQRGVSAEERTLEWIDLETGQRSELGTPGPLRAPKISPDGSTAAIEVRGESQGGSDIWLVDLETGLRTRFTFGASEEATPVWSLDGTHLYYVSRTDEGSRVLRRPVDGTVDADELWRDESFLVLTDVANDGSRLFVARQDRPGNISDVIALALDGSADAQDLLVGDARFLGPVDSPDGRWIAYYGDSASIFDVYVTAADGGSRTWQISTDGGTYPLWSPDGGRLYTLDFDGALAVFDVDGDGTIFRIGDRRIAAQVQAPDRWGNSIDLHPDGRRLLHAVAIESGDDHDDLIEIVTDWRRVLVR